MERFDKKSFETVKAILNAIPNPVIYEDADGVYQYCNNAYYEFSEESPESFLNKTHHDFKLDAFQDVSFEHTYKNRRGDMRYFIVNKILHLNDIGEMIGVIIIMEDVTDKKAAEKEIKMLHLLKDAFLELSHEMVDFENEEMMLKFLLIKVMSIYDVCDQASILEISENETLTVLASEGFHEEDMQNFNLPLEGSFIWKDIPGEISAAHIVNDIPNYTEQGFPEVSIPITGRPVQSSLVVPVWIGKKLKWIFSLDSSYNHVYTETDRKVADYIREELPLLYNLFELYQKTLRMSRYDALTRLQNRHYFDIVHEELYTDSKMDSASYELVLFDLDGLKIINDLHGHPAGDAYLIGFSNFMRDTFKGASHIARVGGDEFAALFTHIDSAELMDLISEARDVFQTLTFKSESTSFKGGFSFGIASYPNDSEDRLRLFQIADTRLYQDKKRAQRRQNNETDSRQ
ncbi:MAG TPA: hypothetical protein DCS67_10675 [Clostridiales bacterium UBA8960]|nr:hypothetical protein [Clostridiales bacterium UBA8960]